MKYRKLNINNKIWEYIIGQKGVKIRNPNGKVTWVHKYVLAGKTEENYVTDCKDLYEDDYDGLPQITIGPGLLKKYIEEKLN